MNQLKLIEDGIIPVYQGEKGHLANARELHEFLGVGKDFSNWIKDRIEKYGFVENEDFIVFAEFGENLSGGRPRTEYILTLDTAKEIAMVQNNEKGSEVRKYFISIEKKYKQSTISLDQLSPELRMFNQLFNTLAKQELEQKQLQQGLVEAKQEAVEAKQEVQAIRDIITINPKAEWRKTTNLVLNKISRVINDFETPKLEAYEALRVRGHCKPKTLITNLKQRALSNGMSKSKVEALNILDVLENEPRLKEIYISIVREMAIKHNVTFKN